MILKRHNDVASTNGISLKEGILLYSFLLVVTLFSLYVLIFEGQEHFGFALLIITNATAVSFSPCVCMCVSVIL